MSITHEQAHQLIQLHRDRILNTQEVTTLSAHLRDCNECQAYADEIKGVETILVPIMKRQWNAQPIPLSIAALVGKSLPKRTNKLLTMRKAAFGLIFIALFFSAWQFVLSALTGSGPIPQAIPPVPTPSIFTAQSPSAQLTLEGCALLPYVVQEHDTLAGIADQFSVSNAMIMELNHIETDTIRLGMELLIPLCDFTPTSTSHAATFTTTHTPILYLTTSTPGG